MTRRTAALAAAALVLTAGLVTVPPAAACGCGGFATAEESTQSLDVIGEQAVVSLVDGTERVQIALDAISDAPDAALVIPTPTPATAELGSAAVFEALQKVSAPQAEEVSVWWPDLPGLWGSGAGDGGAPAGVPVDVHQEVVLGPLEVVSLSSADLDGLLTWLDERGYALSPGLRAGMTDYVTDGWSFVAIKLSPEGEELDGAIPPIQLTFDADALVYPMRLSAAATTAQLVRTYVVADSRTDRTDVQAGGAETLYAGPLDAGAWPALADWAQPFGDAAYVTAVEQRFGDPATDVVADFTFAASGAADVRRTYRVEVDRMVGPIHAGPAFVVLGLALAGATWIGLDRRRSSRVRARSAAAVSSSPR
ncbi:DUF2330 domain-containing protein [Serinibacter arcticus]|nr:DUF2330 domain-containing protein [Serinibacter arcticus]